MRRALAFALLVSLVAGGCGLPDDDRPRLIAEGDAPIDLAPTSQTTDTTPEDAENRVNVFFIDEDDRLQSVRRSVGQATVDEAITALLRGVVEDDPDGLTTAIPPATQLRGPSTLDGDVLTVDLTPAAAEGGIQSVAGEVQIQAFAQLVQTATALSGIRRVRFLVDGAPIQVLTGSGAQTQDPVGRSDYEVLQPG
jgi:spore germination protein GerM